jgi:hypothetical protein
MAKRAALAIYFVAVQSCAAAEESLSVTSIGSFYEDCQKPQTHPLGAVCLGYVSGAFDALMVTNRICPPPRIPYIANVQIFKNWASSHPEYWSMDRFLGVAEALEEKWIAVGMPITGHPPHRSGQARFGHPALTSGV